VGTRQQLKQWRRRAMRTIRIADAVLATQMTNDERSVTLGKQNIFTP